MTKIIAIAFVVIIAAILALAATRPNTFQVQRSISIRATPHKIFPYVNDLRGFGTWSPYEKKDLAMKRTYGGPQAGVGSAYGWEGNKEVGKGRMEIIDSQAPGKVTIKLDFDEPFSAHNTVNFSLVPQGDMTQVTWSMSGPTPYLAKIMHLFFNMDKMVGTDFEHGLANLKALTEK